MIYIFIIVHARIQSGGQASSPQLLKNDKNIGFLSKPVPNPLKYHKATKPALHVRSSSACRNFAGGPMMSRL